MSYLLRTSLLSQTGHYPLNLIGKVGVITDNGPVIRAYIEVNLNYHVYSSLDCDAQWRFAGPIDYHVSSDPKIVNIPPFSFAREQCIYDRFSYTLTSANGNALPSFVSGDSELLIITIGTKDLSDIGSYELRIAGMLSPVLN